MTDPSSTPTPPDPAPLPSSWEVEDAEVRDRPRRRWLVVVAVVLGIAVIGGIAAMVANRGGKEDRAWPDAVGGRPAGLGSEGDTAATITDPTAAPGVYLWNSFDGWHLWVVNGDGVAGVKGTIESTDDISKAEPSSKGSGTVQVDGKTATFDLSGDPTVAGIDFEPGFFSKQITVTLEGPDGPIPAKLVTLGRQGHPKAVPVVIDKPLVSDATTSTTAG
ncbi:MAG: hypothetical protein U0P45_03625 [Acidimicrobiales bacterium]